MAPSDSSPDPVDPERSRRTAQRLLWLSAALTVVVGVFLLADVVGDSAQYGALAWIGVAVAAVSIAALLVAEVACALGRLALNQRLVGKLTVFQLATVLLVVAVGADILIPARDTGSLALLLPWGITYWLHHLTPAA